MDPRERLGDAVAVPPRTGGSFLPKFELPPPPKLGRRVEIPAATMPARAVEPPAAHPAHHPTTLTPTPPPAHAHAHGDGAACSGHGHAPAAPTPPPGGHGHAHAHAPATPTAALARPPAHGHSHGHSPAHAKPAAHAHAHAHGAGGCDGSHGLFDAHHHDWSHLAMAPDSRRLLKLALYVQGAFLLLEVVGGILTNSLALLGDAAHMLADVGALGLALFAAQLAARPADARRTWGSPRAEIVAAAINSGTLVLSCAWIAYEAIRRLVTPESIDGPGLIAIAVAGLLANVFGAWILGRADRDNVNIRAAMMHLLVDAASSVGVIIAGIVIAFGGPVAIDTIASLLIAVVAVRGTWPVLRSSLDSLLDTAPAGALATDVARVLGAAPGVTQVHDVHVWEPGPRRIAATAHVLVAPGTDIGAAIVDLRQLLARDLGIDHATLQVAIDRRGERLDVARVLLRDDAIDHAVQLLTAARPSLDLGRARHAVEAGAAHVHPDGRCSPVRLLSRALRDLER